jgi:hypothetical protein
LVPQSLKRWFQKLERTAFGAQREDVALSGGFSDEKLRLTHVAEAAALIGDYLKECFEGSVFE